METTIMDIEDNAALQKEEVALIPFSQQQKGDNADFLQSSLVAAHDEGFALTTVNYDNDFDVVASDDDDMENLFTTTVDNNILEERKSSPTLEDTPLDILKRIVISNTKDGDTIKVNEKRVRDAFRTLDQFSCNQSFSEINKAFTIAYGKICIQDVNYIRKTSLAKNSLFMQYLTLQILYHFDKNESEKFKIVDQTIQNISKF
jgi:fibronectin type 3 domain-containing protein